MFGGQESIYGQAVGDDVSGGLLLVGSGGTATSLVVSSGGTEVVSAGGTIAGTNIDSGTVIVSAGGTFTGTETLSGGSSLFEFGSGMTGSQTGVISGFTNEAAGNKIEFAGYDTSAIVSAVSSGIVTVSENGSALTVNIAGISAGETLQLTSGGFLDICFLEGTHILAADGERKVETLRAGGMVATLRNGQQVLQPVKWIGHRSVKINGSNMEDAYPVRIRAGAFADAVPHRDLLITQEHCVLVDGMLIPARMLVNGRSIIVDRTIGSYTYYHVELEQHGILLSEGLTTESYLDTGNRGNFANHEAIAIRPDFSVNAAHKSWETDAAAPLMVDRAAVEPVWRMLDERARERGIASIVPPMVLIEDPDLRLATDTGLKIRPMRVANGRYSFFVPANTSRLRLLSRTARPSETVGPFLDDRRALGVLVGEVAAYHRRERVVSNLHLTTPELEGWFAQEDGPRRWTNGNAVLPVSLGAEPMLLEIEVVWAGPYPQEVQARRLTDRKSA
jgi:autotransporter passenger strand-loop-strand repeat protein